METITKNAAETFELGKTVGLSLKGGEILALSGDLGSGKTTFIQGLALSLGIERIISPTFIIMRRYGSFYHLDLYRLEDNIDKELKNLGINEIWGRDKNIVVIEWAEKAESLPKDAKWIRFEYLSDTDRKITL